MINFTNGSAARRVRWWRRVPQSALAAGALLGVMACNVDSMLDVVDPDVATPETILDPNNLRGLQFGAIGDFMVAYSGNTEGGGGTEGIVLSSGLLSDELYVGDTFGTRQEVDRRSISAENAGMTNVFRNVHRARRSAEAASQAFGANTTHERYAAVAHAEVTSLAGYTYLMLAENYCSGVPFSQLTPDNKVEHGDPLTTAQIYDRALTTFRGARGLSTNARQVNLARVGEARTLLDLGRFAEAATVAAAVPTTFVYQLEHSTNTTRQNNGVWAITHNRRGYGVAHVEGGNGLPYRQGNSQSPGSQDPRVRYTRNNRAAIDAPYAFFWQMKYPERGSAIPLATGVEARLIEAEAALRANDLATFLARHNALRATVAGLTPFTAAELAAMTPAQRVDLHFRERGFWLWLTAQRLSDLRRLVRQYGRPAESVFPTGMHRRQLYRSLATPDHQLPWRDHVRYGTDVNFPVPFDELNNPKFVQCLDRNA